MRGQSVDLFANSTTSTGPRSMVMRSVQLPTGRIGTTLLTMTAPAALSAVVVISTPIIDRAGTEIVPDSEGEPVLLERLFHTDLRARAGQNSFDWPSFGGSFPIIEPNGVYIIAPEGADK